MAQKHDAATRIAQHVAGEYQHDYHTWANTAQYGDQPAPAVSDYIEKATIAGIEAGIEFAALLFDKDVLGPGQMVGFGIGNNVAIRKYAGNLPPNPRYIPCNACSYPRPKDCSACEGSGWVIVSAEQQGELHAAYKPGTEDAQ